MKINLKLDKTFTETLNKLMQDYPEELIKLNGFSEHQLDFTDFIDNFVETSTVADATIDGNSNVSTKDIVSLITEMPKARLKLISFNKLFYDIKKMYGVEVAKQWLTNEYTGMFYMHDSATSTFLSYCFNYSFDRLAREGLYFNEGVNHLPPKHLTTYTDMVSEFVSYTSNRTSGGCGIAGVLIWAFYFWKEDCKNGYFQKSPEYYRDNEFQRLIYKLNQNWLRCNQSAYTTISLFDREYIANLFGTLEYPDGTFVIDYVEEIIDFELAFLRVSTAIKEENVMTFPVQTGAFLFDYNKGRFVDEDFAKKCCEINMKFAETNFSISDDITSLASCCLSNKTVVTYLLNNEASFDYIENVYNFVEEKGLKTLKVATYRNGIEVFEDATCIRLPKKAMVKYSVKNESSQNKLIYEFVVTEDHLIPTNNGLVFAKDLKEGMQVLKLENDVLASSFKVIKIEQNTQYDHDYVYCFEMSDRTNPYFLIGEGFLTHNCRLKNSMKDLESLGNFSSIGGSAEEIGSVKVNTINLPRIALDTMKVEDDYIKELKEATILCCQVLDVQRHIIKRNVEKGLLPNYNYEMIKLDKQYSTIGIIGLYEVLDMFGYINRDEMGYVSYSENAEKFAKKILSTITEIKNQFSSEKGYLFNMEQIPGERAAANLLDKNRVMFPDVAQESPLLSNQWISLTENCTLTEKIRVSELLDSWMSGGCITHINIATPFKDFDTAWETLMYVAKHKVSYFAFNTKIDACENNHGFYGSTCPICGKPAVNVYTHVVGFIRPRKAFSKERKLEFDKRSFPELNK